MKHILKKSLTYILSTALVIGSLSVPTVTAEAAQLQHVLSDENAVVISGCESGCPGHVITGETWGGLENAITVSGSHDITLKDIYVFDVNACAFKIADNNPGDVTITLVGNNTLISKGHHAGIEKIGIGDVGTLEINGTGILQVSGGYYQANTASDFHFGGAGIGGTWEAFEGTSNIVINGGTIVATGGAGAAGIGGGDANTASNIVINGGSVTAIGGKDGQNLRIGAAGIGGGKAGSTSNIVINGGSVYVESEGSDNEADLFGYAEDQKPVLPVNDAEKTVRLLEIPNPNGDAVVIDGKAYSPSVHHNISGTEDTLYAYLTEGRHTVQVGDKVTNYVWDEGEEAFLQELTADMFEFEGPDGANKVGYNGEAKAATVTSDKTDGAITVSYYSAEGNKLDSAPTTVGTYKVKIDVAAAGDYASATELTADDWMFEITPAPLTVTGATAENKTYDKTNTVKITNVDIVTKFGSDSVEVDVDDLYGQLSSFNAGSYTEVTLPDTLKLKGDHISNYKLTQPTLPVSTNVTISKAAVAPNKPGATLSASNSTETVGAIAIGDLYPGWDWSEADKEISLVSGNSVDATAVYTAEDKANYETVTTVVAITRSNCDHEEAEEIIVSANTIPGEKEPNCTETGIGHAVCEKCGETVRGGVEIPALGHTGGTATCKDLAVCTRCDEPYGEKDMQNHVGGAEVKNAVEATCTTAGHTGYTECKGCEYTIDPGVTIPALNHKGYTAVEGKKDATCTATGYTGDTRCKKCGELIAKGTVTAAKGHKWDGGVVTTAPAIGKTGAKKYTCGMCKTTKTETIAALSAPASGTVAADDTKAATYQVTKSGAIGGEVEYVAPSAKKSSVTIPDTVTIDGVVYNVTSVAKNAFEGNKKISKVTIGANVTKIGANAFNGCKKLKTVTIKSEKLKSVGKNAFKGIKSKATIKVPKKKMKAYKKMLKKRGVSSKAKYKKA